MIQINLILIIYSNYVPSTHSSSSICTVAVVVDPFAYYIDHCENSLLLIMLMMTMMVMVFIYWSQKKGKRRENIKFKFI